MPSFVPAYATLPRCLATSQPVSQSTNLAVSQFQPIELGNHPTKWLPSQATPHLLAKFLKEGRRLKAAGGGAKTLSAALHCGCVFVTASCLLPRASCSQPTPANAARHFGQLQWSRGLGRAAAAAGAGRPSAARFATLEALKFDKYAY